MSGEPDEVPESAVEESAQTPAAHPPSPPGWLKTWRHRYQGQPWGFVAFYDVTEPRLQGSAMEEFKAQALKYACVPFDSALKQGHSTDDITAARNHFEIRWVETKSTNDKSEREAKSDRPQGQGDLADELRAQYQAMKDSGNLPHGLSTDVFLYATTDAIHSVQTTLPSGEDNGGAKFGVTNQYWRAGAPFLVAVHEVDAIALDAADGVNPEEEVGRAGENGWYKPVFKAALESLVEELWWILVEDFTDFWKITRFVRRAQLETNAPPEDKGDQQRAGDKGPAVGQIESHKDGQEADSTIGEDGLMELWWTMHIPPQLLRKRRRW